MNIILDVFRCLVAVLLGMVTSKREQKQLQWSINMLRSVLDHPDMKRFASETVIRAMHKELDKGNIRISRYSPFQGAHLRIGGWVLIDSRLLEQQSTLVGVLAHELLHRVQHSKGKGTCVPVGLAIGPDHLEAVKAHVQPDYAPEQWLIEYEAHHFGKVIHWMTNRHFSRKVSLLC